MQTQLAMDIVEVMMRSPNPERPGRQGIPVVIVGPPGIGKTQHIGQRAAKIGYHLFTAIGATMQPEDVAGLPRVDSEGRTVWTVPELVWRCKSRPTVLFFDEANRASREVQAALLHTVQEGKCGSHYLPDYTPIVMAINPAHLVGGNSFDAAMANRVAWVYMDADAADWTAWAARHQPSRDNDGGHGLDRDDRVKYPVAAWNNQLPDWDMWWPIVQSNVVGFITAHPTALGANTTDAKVLSRANPTPRSITNAMYAMTTAAAMGRLELMGDVAAALVGEGWVTEYLAYLAEADLTDPRALLDGTVPMPLLDATRPDRALALSTGLMSYARTWGPSRGTPDMVERFWNASAVIATAFPDMGETMVREALNSNNPVLRATSATRTALAAMLKLDSYK